MHYHQKNVYYSLSSIGIQIEHDIDTRVIMSGSSSVIKKI